MTLRDRQAEHARRLILRAATELFVEKGYLGTTMDDIAEKAAVARRTLYNQFGSKAALLIAAINDRVVAPEERSQASDQRAVADLDQPEEIIDAFIRAHIGVATRSLPILEVTYGAAAVDPEVARAYEQNEAQRYEMQQLLVQILSEKGLLRTDVSIDYLKRGFWLLAGPPMLVAATRAGWDVDTYARWLKETVTGLLLDPREG